jgi:hypothetical protein
MNVTPTPGTRLTAPRRKAGEQFANVNVRMPLSLVEKVERIAAATDRSRGAVIRELVKAAKVPASPSVAL